MTAARNPLDPAATCAPIVGFVSRRAGTSHHPDRVIALLGAIAQVFGRIPSIGAPRPNGTVSRRLAKSLDLS